MIPDDVPARRWSARGLPGRAMSRATARQAEFRHAVRVSVAVGAAFAISSLFHLPQGYWSVFTAVIVVQTSIGGTITASLERLLGTVVGALVGVAGAYLRARTVVEEGLVLSAAVAILAFAAAVRPQLRVAPITAAIVLVGGVGTHMDPILAAIWRVIEILIGSAIGVAATLLVFPAQARKAVAGRVGAAAIGMAHILDLYAQTLADGAVNNGLQSAHQATRKQLAAVEQTITEAARETASGLRGGDVPEALLRTLLRVRSDTVLVGRALASPLPPTVARLLAVPAQALLGTLAIQLRLCADRPPTPDPQALAQPQAVFETAVEGVRQAKLTSDMTFEAVSRVFGLVFALEGLTADVGDLCDRVTELDVGGPAPLAHAHDAALAG